MSNRIVGYIKAVLQLLFLSQENHIVGFLVLSVKLDIISSLQLFFKKCMFLVMYRNAFFK